MQTPIDSGGHPTMKGWSFSLPTFLAVMTTLGLFFFITLLIFRSVPEETRTPVFALVATIANGWGIVLGYHFGSSAGSAKKTDLLSQADKPKDGE